MREIYISANNDCVHITVAEEIDEHKSRLFISDSEIVRLQNKVKSIHDSIKSNANYVRTNLVFVEIDHYDSCDSFEVPYFYIKKGSRTVSVEIQESNDIPKDWSRDINIHFKRPKQYGIIFKALENFINIDATRKKEITKILKINGNITIEY